MSWPRTVAVCALVAVAPAIAGDAQRPAPAEVAVNRIPVTTLLHEYQTNEIRAEALYADREVDVSGMVVRVIRTRYAPADQLRDAYVVELLAPPLDVSDAVINFYFDRAARDQLLPLRAGQEVVIHGRCSRPVVRAGDLRPNGKDVVEVRVQGCRIVAAR